MLIQCPQCSSRYNASVNLPGDLIHCRCGVDIHVPQLANIARSWNCPNCAGSVDPKENTCQYCDAYLAFARCPACFSIAPYDDAKHCAECGESLLLPIKVRNRTDEEMSCPRCDSNLTKKVIDKHVVDLCRDCGGVWLEHHRLDMILEDAPLNTTAVLGKIANKSAKTLPRHAIRYLACPECDDMMSRHNFMHDSNIILDQCNTHGVWFDKYELAAALEFLRSQRDRTSKKALIKETNKLTESDDIGEKIAISNRKENEVVEIKDEYLQLLLQEFPDWILSDNKKG